MRRSLDQLLRVLLGRLHIGDNAHDTGHAGDDLDEDRRGHRLSVNTTMTVNLWEQYQNPEECTIKAMRAYPEVLDDLVAASNVASRSAERFGESAHQDVHIGPRNDLCVVVVRAEARLGNAPRPYTVVVADAAAVRAKGADGVRFVDEEVELRGVNACS